MDWVVWKNSLCGSRFGENLKMQTDLNILVDPSYQGRQLGYAWKNDSWAHDARSWKARIV